MKKKSKFVIFILSFLPGLSHLYIGARERATIFFLFFFGAIFGMVGFSAVINNDRFILLLGFALPLIWFVALVDAMSWVDKDAGKPEGSEDMHREKKNTLASFDNRRLITIASSIIPGAGHMYLGLMRQGVQLMGLFFFAAFLMGWLNMSLFLFVLPVIWFYSLFDAYHRVTVSSGRTEEEGIFLLDWMSGHPKWVGWSLIVLGCLVIFERIISPLIYALVRWEIRGYIQTGIVAVILIFCGIKLLAGSRPAQEGKEDPSCGKEE